MITLFQIQSLSLRWPWPEKWINGTFWVFTSNLDVWEITKVSSNKTYKSVENYFTESELMPYTYWYLLVAWAALLFLYALAFIVAYCVLTKKEDPFMMVKIAKMQQVYIILSQVKA